MNSAESPRKETTRLSALATGLRLTTTAAPKISVSSAKVQNRNGAIFQATDEPGSNTDVKSECQKSVNICVNLWLLLLFVPFEHHAVHYSADFEQLLLVMHHFRAREARDGVVFTQKDRLLGTNLLAHPAENAA